MSVKVQLSQGKFATIDKKDWSRVSLFKWTFTQNGSCQYAHRKKRENGRARTIYLHHFIYGKTIRLDHRNGDGLDNRRRNLRPATCSQNQQNRGIQKNNTSGYKGVFYASHAQKWRARIWVHGRVVHLGYFTNRKTAGDAYKKAARRLHRDFAKWN